MPFDDLQGLARLGCGDAVHREAGGIRLRDSELVGTCVVGPTNERELCTVRREHRRRRRDAAWQRAGGGLYRDGGSSDAGGDLIERQATVTIHERKKAAVVGRRSGTTSRWALFPQRPERS